MLSRRWLQVAVFVTLVLATMVSGGCIRIQVIDRTPSSSDLPCAPEAEEVEEHDVAVLAVDFDPPLEYEQIVDRKNRGEGITLLVAIENTGLNAEQDVAVEVQLSESSEQTVLLHKQGTIETIAPGEIKIVQFKDTEIPFSYQYLLQVSVVPVDGETRVGDNQKNYDLLITQP